jgi:NAD(P)-dependent dehydrogenase (short-subunit alcohol dehydrogenase family)
MLAIMRLILLLGAIVNRIHGRALILGSSGVLGKVLIDHFHCRGHTVYAGSRYPQKLEDIFDDKKVIPFEFKYGIDPFPENNGNFPKEVFDEFFDDGGSNVAAQNLVVVNNAAVCSKGKDVSDLKEAMAVNTLGPLRLSNLIINRALQSHLRPCCNITIINISSGDGELLMLNSGVAKNIEKIDDLDVLEDFILRLIDNYDSSIEFACGPTPFYSLSKALLNKGSQILNKYLHGGEIAGHNRARIICVCPGDFSSPIGVMTAGTVDFQSPEICASYIVDIALGNPYVYPSGKFYRHGKRISW